MRKPRSGAGSTGIHRKTHSGRRPRIACTAAAPNHTQPWAVSPQRHLHVRAIPAPAKAAIRSTLMRSSSWAKARAREPSKQNHSSWPRLNMTGNESRNGAGQRSLRGVICQNLPQIIVKRVLGAQQLPCRGGARRARQGHTGCDRVVGCCVACFFVIAVRKARTVLGVASGVQGALQWGAKLAA